MMRILIVDDNAKVRREIAKELARSFPGALLDEAGSLYEAISNAEAALVTQPYDVAVLDFLLPLEPQGTINHVYPDVRRRLLKTLGRETAMFNYTTNSRHTEVVDFLIDKNLQDTELPRPVVIDKDESGWLDRLVTLVRSAVHSQRVGAEFGRLFGTRREATRRAAERPLEAAGLRGDLLGVADLTQDLNLLARDIEMHWDDLADEVKNEVRSVFQVKTEEGRVRVRS